ncbi:MAG: tryptophan--tRNA ligase [Candidatus Altiarchaeales archaeon]|nr:tryptophan--tRNA ligase [Candidatus Altiarchaeales archaeon]
MDERLDPWGSVEVADYERLMKKFGIESAVKYQKKFNDLIYFRRGIIFGHRDFGRIADAIENRKRFAMMTGMMPSGTFHLGHKMVADEIIWFQKKKADIFICAADIESYLMRDMPLDKARKIAIEEYLTNYVALGLKPENVTFWFQSDYKKEYYRLCDIAAKEVTFNELKGIYGELTNGKIISALKQVGDILHPQLKEFGGPRPVVVPVGTDQDPHLRLSRDISSRLQGFNMIPPSATYHKLMSGLQGGKMSSSKPDSYISLSGNPKTESKKVLSAKTGGRATLEEQKKLGGIPEQCVVYEMCFYHLVEDDKELEEMRSDCKSGKLLCGECKKKCSEKLEKFLAEHQKKRVEAGKIVEKILKQK